LRNMRNHGGKHIMLEKREKPDPKIDEDAREKIGLFPCGWCGVEGCRTEMEKRSKKAPVITSSCEYHYSGMQYGRAIGSSTTTPCTNVPIQCTLC
ncbi:hypothetical protein B0H34DRAFT_616012, partial [Crassisporium funariophilum]